MTEQAAPRPGFFKRNWKWLVPVGCLTPLLCCGGGAVAIAVSAFGVMKQSPVFVEAVARASNNPEVAGALGAPLTTSWWLSGNLNESGGSGTANFAVPVSGPKGSGTLFVEAKESAGTWRYESLQVDVGGRRIDLSDPGAGPEPDSVAEPEEEDVPGE